MENQPLVALLGLAKWLAVAGRLANQLPPLLAVAGRLLNQLPPLLAVADRLANQLPPLLAVAEGPKNPPHLLSVVVQRLSNRMNPLLLPFSVAGRRRKPLTSRPSPVEVMRL